MRLNELLIAGADVRVCGRPLTERLSPRQLKFLFATGAIQAGRAAGRLTLGQHGSVKAAIRDPGAREKFRATVGQAMGQHVASYKALKAQRIKDLMKFPSSAEAILAGGKTARKEYTAWTRDMARGASRIKAGLVRFPWQPPKRTFDASKLLFRVGR